MGRPSFPFYPNDWLNDLALRGCTPASRAVWIDLMCMMHEGVPYGHLADATGQLTVKFLASRCGITIKQFTLAIEELEQHGVFSRLEDGTIYSRRMVRDEYRRLVRGHGGQQSLNSPYVPRPKRIPSSEKEGILPSGSEGILSSTNIVPPFDSVKGNVVSFSSHLRTEECFDAIPGWLKFKEQYPPHRINAYMDCQLWMSIVETPETEALILRKLPIFKQSEQWSKDNGKFVPKASKFLGERLFEMEPGPPMRPIPEYQGTQYVQVGLE